MPGYNAVPKLNMVRDEKHSSLAKYSAEFVGTYFLVLTVGCNVHTKSLCAALSIGAVLMAMIFALGSVSGAHLNPAVTLSVLLAGRKKIPASDAVIYMVVQSLAGIVAALTYGAIFNDAFMMSPGGTYSMEQVVAVEVFFAAALCYVVLNVATCEARPHSTPNGYFGIAIGFTVVSSAIAIGPVSGCSLNPAVSIGALSAAVSHNGKLALLNWSGFVFAPFGGSMLAVVAFFLARGGMSHTMEYAQGQVTRTRAVEVEVEVEAPPIFKEPPMSPIVVSAPPPPSRGRSPPPEELPVMSLQRPLKLKRHSSALFGPDLSQRDLLCGLYWHTKQQGGSTKTFDVDLACLKYNHRGKYMGLVYFAAKTDDDNGISHTGDDVVGSTDESSMDCEEIAFNTGRLTGKAQILIFVAIIFSEGGDVKKFTSTNRFQCRIIDKTAQTNLVTYNKESVDDGNALVVAMVYRRGNEWAFKAIDESYAVGEHKAARVLDETGRTAKYVAQALKENAEAQRQG